MACAHPLRMQPSLQLGSHFFTYPEPFYVPCGYCVNCRADLINYFSDRAEYEYCKRLTAAFCTFTYDDIYLVDRCVVTDSNGIVFDDDKPRCSLNYKDIRNFIHAIRKKVQYYYETHPNVKVSPLMQPDFSYMYCGEYGGLGRCHFHVIFFGLDFAFCKKLLFENWKYGFIDVLPLLDGGIRYVCKYINKMEKGYLAWLKYDVKGLARPKICFSKNFGQSLLWDNVEDIVEHNYCYRARRGVRRPISAYWRLLLHGNATSLNVNKKSFFVPDPYYISVIKKQTAARMRSMNLHHKVNVMSKYEQRKFRLEQALKREKTIITQLHNEHTPVYDDFNSVVKSRFGFVTYDGKKIRKLPTWRQRLLVDEYKYCLEKEWLYEKFS